MLQILYRAATRSFHSTRILRHLFIVHTSLAEFELGRKALDSYFDIVVKGKARAEKFKESQLGLDDDATIVYTAAIGIKFLCLHGRWEEGKRSLALGAMLGEWLQEHHSDVSSNTNQELGNFLNMLNGEDSANKDRLSPNTLATGFCALGISQAHWSNLTCDVSERAAFQAKALSNFRIASSIQVGDHAKLEILNAFALALAKTHDIDAAVGVVKKALSSDANDSLDEDLITETRKAGYQLLRAYNRRQVLKSWHLLALLLSAKQNFSTAMASCEAALELFGLGSATSDSRSTFMIENIELCDRESIMEISMTQLALAEIVNGPEEALNHFRDLLILFKTFFNYSEKVIIEDVMETRVSPPASKNGTTRSFRSSIIGRSRERKRNPLSTKATTQSPGSNSSESDPGVIQKTPTISVTTEDSPPHHGVFHTSHHFHHTGSKKLRKSNSKKSINSGRRGRTNSTNERPTTNSLQLDSDIPAQRDQNYRQPSDNFSLNAHSFAADEVGIAISHDIPPVPRPSTAASIPSSNAHAPQQISSVKERPRVLSLPAAQLPLSTKVSSPETLPPPPPLFPSTSQQRRSLILLTKIWLQVAALYRRAKMPKDANVAISEALSQISVIEKLVSLKHSSTESFSTPDWGGVPSVSELWADALSERARLHDFLQEREEAEADYETALTHFPDHSGAIIGLSNILLEYSSPIKNPRDPSSSSSSLPHSTSPPTPSPSPPKSAPLLAPNLTPSSKSEPHHPPASQTDGQDDDDETLLPRLSARDRATGLLSSLTRNGQGWDCAEAWFALARAYELRGQVDKAKEALWWVVELEETRPVRGWGCLSW